MKNPRAFTLVETLVAIAVLTISITIPFISAEKALLASYQARDQLVASSLAQEGVEFIRSVRDSNAIAIYYGASRTWLAGFDGTQGPYATYANCTAAGAFCAVDASYPSIISCSGMACSNHPVDVDSNGWYNQTGHISGGGYVTQFFRAVQFTNVNAHEEKVTVTVTWTTAHVAHTVQVVDYLDNWETNS